MIERNKTNTEKYEIGKVYVLPKHLDEKVARLHLEGVQGMITFLASQISTNQRPSWASN